MGTFITGPDALPAAKTNQPGHDPSGLTYELTAADINAIWLALDDVRTKVLSTLPIAGGGTGQTTASAAIAALLPNQALVSGKFLQTTGGGTLGWSTAITGLSGDVTNGLGGGVVSTTVRFVGGSAAADVNSAELLANASTSTPTASTIARWDSHLNLFANSFADGWASTATAAGTTTLTAASAQTQRFTGTTTQTVALPNATTMAVGQSFRVINRSTGPVTVNDGSGSLVLAVAAGDTVRFTVVSNGSSAGAWDAGASIGGGGSSGPFVSSVADGPTAIAFDFSTSNTLADPGAKLFKISNNGTELWHMNAAGTWVLHNDYPVDVAFQFNRYEKISWGGHSWIRDQDGNLCVGGGNGLNVGGNVNCASFGCHGTDAGNGVILEGSPADGSTAVATRLSSAGALTTAGAVITTFENPRGTLKAFVDKDGYFKGAGIVFPDATTQTTAATAGTILPSQTGNSGKYLTTNGTTASWATVVAGISALTGDVTASGSGSVAATVATVGGSSATNVHSAELLANAATATLTASTIPKWDANSNLQANSLVAGFTTTVSANATTTLTAASAQQQQLTGTLSQTFTLPDATTLKLGQSFRIINRSTGSATVNKNGGSLALVVATGNDVIFTCTSIGSSAGSWDAALPPVSIIGSSGRIPYYTGATVLDSDSTFLWDSTNHRLSLGTPGSASYLLWLNSPNANDGIKILVPAGAGANAQVVFSAGSEPAFGQGALLQLNSVSNTTDANAFQLFNRTNGALIFGTNNAENARFLANGKLLINRTTDDGTSSQFQVGGSVGISSSASTDTLLTIQNSAGSFASAVALNFKTATKQFDMGLLGTSNGTAPNDFYIYDHTASAFRLVLTSSGHMLVGTTTDNGQAFQIATAGSHKIYSAPGTSNLVPYWVVDASGGKVNTVYAGSGDCGVCYDSTSDYYFLQDTAANIRAGTALGTTTVRGSIRVTTGNWILGSGTSDNGQKLQVAGNFAFTARHTVADAGYTVTTSDYVVAYTSISAARAVTLPSAAAGNSGQEVAVVDESGSCSGTNTITISTVLGGSIVLGAAYAYARVRSNGSAWVRVG